MLWLLSRRIVHLLSREINFLLMVRLIYYYKPVKKSITSCIKHLQYYPPLFLKSPHPSSTHQLRPLEMKRYAQGCSRQVHQQRPPVLRKESYCEGAIVKQGAPIPIHSHQYSGFFAMLSYPPPPKTSNCRLISLINIERLGIHSTATLIFPINHSMT